MAFFFKKFPKTDYAFVSEPKNKKTITNILTAFFLRKISFVQNLIYSSYTIKDDDTPESLSKKFYNNPQYYWTPLVINNIIDPYSEWAMPPDILERFTAKKYKDGKNLKKVDRHFLSCAFQ